MNFYFKFCQYFCLLKSEKSRQNFTFKNFQNIFIQEIKIEIALIITIFKEGERINYLNLNQIKCLADV